MTKRFLGYACDGRKHVSDENTGVVMWPHNCQSHEPTRSCWIASGILQQSLASYFFCASTQEIFVQVEVVKKKSIHCDEIFFAFISIGG